MTMKRGVGNMRQLGEADKEKIFEYIGKEPELNLFLYGALERLGVDSAVNHVYVWEKEADWECLVLQYYDDYCIYSQKETYPMQEVLAFLKQRPVDCIRGKIAHVKPLHEFYPERILKENMLCRLEKQKWEQMTQEACAFSGMEQVEVKRLYGKDTADMMQVYLASSEFARNFRDPEKSEQRIKEELAAGEVAVGIYENGIPAAVARTNATSSQGALVVYVAVSPAYRRKRYGMGVVSALCQEAFAEGREVLCLYYSSPVAGRIYKKIGFEEVGDYAMLR
ncbi:MAG: GNAT family N-acetyltransferase [Lachnospiraceae bacterium]|nr:GNAT family N-acetyltransferase [Lachnospiraceae bacterium]